MNDFIIFILFAIGMAIGIRYGGMKMMSVAAAVLVFGGLYLYFRGNPLAESYIGREVVVGKKEVALEPENPPYTTRPIMTLADYDDVEPNTECQAAALEALEYDVVARNKAEMSSKIKRDRLNANHFNVDKLPADSQIRVEAREMRGAPVPAGAAALEGFADIEAAAFTPPDKAALEAEEKKMLAMYRPKEAAELTTYSIDNPEDLIKKIYKDRKQVPSYRQREDGAWEVYEVQDENPTIVWEDDVVAAGGARPVRADAPGDYVEVPVAARQYMANMDPDFQSSGRMRTNRGDYTQFAPELDRVFSSASSLLA